MKTIKAKGKSVEDAIEAALKILGLKRDQIEYQVINEGRGGMLGIIGGEEAEVEVRQKMTKINAAKQYIQEVLNTMRLMAVAEAEEDEKGRVQIDIKGEDLGQIIGKDGNTLNALQVLASAALSHWFSEKVKVYIDAGGYKEKKAGALRRLAIDAAKDVEETKKEKHLPPMSAAERRIIHIALKDDPKVETISEGEGAERHLIIKPK